MNEAAIAETMRLALSLIDADDQVGFQRSRDALESRIRDLYAALDAESVERAKDAAAFQDAMRGAQQESDALRGEVARLTNALKTIATHTEGEILSTSRSDRMAAHARAALEKM